MFIELIEEAIRMVDIDPDYLNEGQIIGYNYLTFSSCHQYCLTIISWSELPPLISFTAEIMTLWRVAKPFISPKSVLLYLD